MNDLRKAAEMALETLCVGANDAVPNDIDERFEQAIQALRQALDDKPPVKSYCGGKPNYCVPLQSDRIRIDPVTGDVSIGTVDAVNMSQESVDDTAKSEHEPIGYINGTHGGYMVFTPLNPSAVYLNGTALYLAPPKQEYQYEVVAEHADGTYTTKRIPKRDSSSWVGLTDEEIYDYADKFLYQHGSNYGIRSFGKAIEAKLKEKNT